MPRSRSLTLLYEDEMLFSSLLLWERESGPRCMKSCRARTKEANSETVGSLGSGVRVPDLFLRPLTSSGSSLTQISLCCLPWSQTHADMLRGRNRSRAETGVARTGHSRDARAGLAHPLKRSHLQVSALDAFTFTSSSPGHLFAVHLAMPRSRSTKNKLSQSIGCRHAACQFSKAE